VVEALAGPAPPLAAAGDNYNGAPDIGTRRSSATAEGPRDALYQLKYCQLLHIYAKKNLSERLAKGD